jgi:superoxide dismutase, Fe-Mn family
MTALLTEPIVQDDLLHCRKEPALEPTLPRREFLKLSATLGASLLTLNALGPWLSVQSAQAAVSPSPTSPKKSAASATPQPSKGQPVASPASLTMPVVGALVAKDFSARLAKVQGLSTLQLEKHVALYQGYVKAFNAIQQAVAQTDAATLSSTNISHHPYRELHVEASFALNGVVLHELYFENLGPQSAQLPPEALHQAIQTAFGAWPAYEQQLLALGKASRGWVITGFNHRSQRVENYILDAHNQAVPVGVSPLLVLDVYEHAYVIDFATNRPAYLDVFLRNIDWQVVAQRLNQATLA